MKTLNSFKTFGLLSVVGLAGLGVFSCKKDKPNAQSQNTQQQHKHEEPKLDAVGLGFGTIIFNAGKLRPGAAKYDSKGVLQIYKKNATSNPRTDSTIAAFADKTKTDYELVVPTGMGRLADSRITGAGNGDVMVLTLNVEEGATVLVTKQETPDTTMFSFGVGRMVNDTIVAGLPHNLVKHAGIPSVSQVGNVIVLQLNTTYKNLIDKMKVATNNVKLTVTASKSGKASVTKTLTVKGGSSTSAASTTVKK